MITRVNIRQSPKGFRTIDGTQFDGWVFIGRPGRFGSPIPLAKRFGQHCPVCGLLHLDAGSTLVCYEKWLRAELKRNKEFRKAFYALNNIPNLKLVCFCATGAECHGNVIKSILDEPIRLR